MKSCMCNSIVCLILYQHASVFGEIKKASGMFVLDSVLQINWILVSGLRLKAEGEDVHEEEAW